MQTAGAVRRRRRQLDVVTHDRQLMTAVDCRRTGAVGRQRPARLPIITQSQCVSDGITHCTVIITVVRRYTDFFYSFLGCDVILTSVCGAEVGRQMAGIFRVFWKLPTR